MNPDRNSQVYVYPGLDGPFDSDTVQYVAARSRWETVGRGYFRIDGGASDFDLVGRNIGVSVPTLRSHLTGVTAFDICPNGAPSDQPGSGKAWMDICNGDVYANNLIDCSFLHLGAAAATLVIASRKLNNGSILNISFQFDTVPTMVLDAGHVNAMTGVSFNAQSPDDATHMALGALNGTGYLGTTTNHPIALYANSSEKVRIDANGNVGMGTTSFGTSATRVLAIANGVAPSTSPANVGQLYVLAGALRFRGASGTDTLVAAA